MKKETAIEGLWAFEPGVFRDGRGYFLETFNHKRYAGLGLEEPFVQDNLSFSRHGVLRGMHFQNPCAQGKLVSVISGEVFDVAVDLRRDSATFGQWHGELLSSENHRQLWIPPGFAHGFVVTGEHAFFHYKCTGLYAPHAEQSVRWDDPDLAIDWPIETPILSPKDADAPYLRDLDPAVFF